eukprot:TRINITY_DN5987_c0_g1_i1.p1 TRINITY_DN5987_c0_g1~~TRINITY_DN5987_c0_g1_i1.p1  ORF type:complete len:1042 (-),score=143.59 TRINITY_DN5987_c0_g1_i1:209-3334(-)
MFIMWWTVLNVLFYVTIITVTQQLPEPQTKKYYLQAELIDWNYLPEQRDACYGSDKWKDDFNKGNKEGKFVKAAYRLYEDEQFTKQANISQEMEHTGLIGAIMYGEGGDVLEVVFRNTLPFAINVDPSGVTVLDTDGPVAPVGTNETVTYKWFVSDLASPNDNEKSSKFWIFRSTVDLVGHANAGLIGGVVVVKKGQADTQGKPSDVDIESFLALHVYNEAQSSLIDVNFPKGLSEEEEEELIFYSINGYVWCHMPFVEIPINQVGRWYVFGVGNEIDVHNAHWHGNVLDLNNRTVDDIIVLPGTNEVLDMKPQSPGLWLLHCHVNEHLGGGMIAMYRAIGEAPLLQMNGSTRKYYIAADPIDWDYTPTGLDQCLANAIAFDEDQKIFVEQTNTTMGSKYLKAIFREYTDDTFTKLVVRPPQEEHLGMIGPLLRAEIGDTIEIVFKNNVDFPASMHTHGLWYSKANEGTPYLDETSEADKLDDAIPTGQTYTYVWKVIPEAGPTENELSSKLWMYHSHTDEIRDTNAGLIGPILISQPGTLGEDGLPEDVDREFVLFFSVIDEVTSLLFDVNLYHAFGSSVYGDTLESEEFAESNLMHQINGYMYCNLPGLVAYENERVRLHTFALGTVIDMHSASLGGSTFQDGTNPQQASIAMDPGSMSSVDIVPVSQGEWTVQCNIADHIAAGMVAKFQVLEPKQSDTGERNSNGQVVRQYYIAATEVMWDYFPVGKEGCTDGEYNDVFVSATPSTLGSIYKKSVYREYTDDSFSILDSDQNQVLGLQGPLIEMEVGDVVEVYFLNNLTTPSGLDIYAGLIALHDVEAGREVSPGSVFTYKWEVPESAGPQVSDLSTVIYPYTSPVDKVSSLYGGLVGTAVVGKRGSLAGKGKVEGVDLVLPLLFMINNENESPYIEQNIKLTEEKIGEVVDVESEEFEESNLLHGINGYIYCNLDPVEVQTGQIVRVYLLSLGSEVDMHGPIFPGQILLQQGKSSSPGIELMPGVARAMDLQITTPGEWVIRCDAHDHYFAGMTASMIVGGETLSYS